MYFEELGIPGPSYSFGVGTDSHGRQTAAILESIEGIIETEAPDGVLLYVKANSTLAGTIAASKIELLATHVEAGLRSHNRDMPEEIIPVLTDHASDLLFAPSDSAAEPLVSD